MNQSIDPPISDDVADCEKQTLFLLFVANLTLAFPLRGRCQIRFADLTDEV